MLILGLSWLIWGDMGTCWDILGHCDLGATSIISTVSAVYSAVLPPSLMVFFFTFSVTVRIHNSVYL